VKGFLKNGWGIFILGFAISIEGAEFFSRSPSANQPSAPLLLVLGGVGSSGGNIVRDNADWARFADENKLWLLSATFAYPKNVLDRKQCYYYPESGSMEWLAGEIDRLAKRNGLREKRLLMSGVSGGAHFVHRFALWNPDRVTALAAYSAAWWDEPASAIKKIPMLIMCGEEDERYEPSIMFYRKASLMGCPVLWRSFSNLGHEMDQRVIRLAQTFLKEFVRERKSTQPWVGDIQEWKAYPKDHPEARRIPLEYRVAIPSETVAKVWEHADE